MNDVICEAEKITKSWASGEVAYAKALVGCAHNGAEIRLDPGSNYRMFRLPDESMIIFYLPEKTLSYVVPGLINRNRLKTNEK